MKSSLTILFLLLSQLLLAQTNWAAIEKDLTKLREEKKISLEEWYSRLKFSAGHLGTLSLWTLTEEEKITDKNIENGIKLYFPKNFQVIASKGNKYAKVYLQNNTLEPLEIERIDATIANIQEYFLIKGKWVAFRKNQTSTCGNSYFNSYLNPNCQLALQLDNEVLTEGKNMVKYKIALMLGKNSVESNIITVNLHNRQLKRILESVNN